MNRKRIVLVLVTVVILSLVGGVIITRTVLGVWGSFDGALNSNMPAIQALNEIKAVATGAQASTLNYALTLDEAIHSTDDGHTETAAHAELDIDAQLAEAHESIDKLWLALEDYAALSSSPDASIYVEQIREDALALESRATALLDIKAAGVTGPDVLTVLNEFEAAQQDLNETIVSALAYENEQLEHARETIASNFRTAPIIVGSLALFTLLITNGFGISLNRQYRGQEEAQARIAEQNKALSKAVREIAEAKRQADEANRLKSEFLATMSHELRTPLNAILGFTQVMLAGMSGTVDDEARAMLMRVQSNGKRLLGLINDILDLAKIEAQRIDIVARPFDPRALTGGLLEQVSTLAEEKGLQLEIQIDPDLPPQLLGDDGQISKIMTNLLSNAIKFTEKGRIDLTLEAQHASETWNIVVADTGIGIPPHALEFIFDPFRQADGSTQRAYQGTGLGLAIVQELTRAMGGVVLVDSTVGKGSTFTVKLPLVSATIAEVMS